LWGRHRRTKPFRGSMSISGQKAGQAAWSGLHHVVGKFFLICRDVKSSPAGMVVGDRQGLPAQPNFIAMNSGRQRLVVEPRHSGSGPETGLSPFYPGSTRVPTAARRFLERRVTRWGDGEAVSSSTMGPGWRSQQPRAQPGKRRKPEASEGFGAAGAAGGGRWVKPPP